MNIKIAEKSVTFKITEEEMHVLLSGQVLEKHMPIGGSVFSMAIDPNSGEGFETVPLKLVLDKDEFCMMLCTTREEVQKLSDMGRSRDGISVVTDGFEVTLQVDVRADSRPKKKG